MRLRRGCVATSAILTPGAYPIDFFLSRPKGFGARGAAAEAAFRRLSIEERDEVVAALVAEFKAGERKEL